MHVCQEDIKQRTLFWGWGLLANRKSINFLSQERTTHYANACMYSFDTLTSHNHERCPTRKKSNCQSTHSNI